MINNVNSFSINELLSFDFCKILKTPKYVNHNIIVFRNGQIYSLNGKKFLTPYLQSKNKDNCLSVRTFNENCNCNTAINIPYVICYLFRNDQLKHNKYENNYFVYRDGNCKNCDADNIIANHYEYEIIKFITEDVVLVNICDYEVLLNIEFVKNELYKYRFRVIKSGENGKCIYFVSENSGKNMKLHQIVMNYYNPDLIITGVIDHCDHNTLNNTIQNLAHTNHIINSMNNLKIVPNWREATQSWIVRYKIDGSSHSKTFSVWKYGTKEMAYKNAIEYIDNTVVPLKKEFIKNKDLQIKMIEFNNLVKYFIDNNMTNNIFEILSNNNLIINENVIVK